MSAAAATAKAAAAQASTRGHAVSRRTPRSEGRHAAAEAALSSSQGQVVGTSAGILYNLCAQRFHSLAGLQYITVSYGIKL